MILNDAGEVVECDDVVRATYTKSASSCVYYPREFKGLVLVTQVVYKQTDQFHQ